MGDYRVKMVHTEVHVVEAETAEQAVGKVKRGSMNIIHEYDRFPEIVRLAPDTDEGGGG